MWVDVNTPYQGYCFLYFSLFNVIITRVNKLYEHFLNSNYMEMQESYPYGEGSEGEVTVDIPQEICECIFPLLSACGQCQALFHQCHGWPPKSKFLLFLSYQDGKLLIVKISPKNKVV